MNTWAVRWSLLANVLCVLRKTGIFDFLCASSLNFDCELTIVKIIDSIMALFRVDYSGRGELSERQQKVSYLKYELRLGDRPC